MQARRGAHCGLWLGAVLALAVLRGGGVAAQGAAPEQTTVTLTAVADAAVAANWPVHPCGGDPWL
ncbi:MAG: hypothetical protein GX605_03935 [Chloroflexi bacterium]|nr:hypothetical protein [Chloroflexota bacterium]